MRLVMVNHDRSVTLSQGLYLVNRHALSRASARQSQSLWCDAVVGIEENEIAILEFRFDSREPEASLHGPL
jgi:hypothetical protein